MNITYKNILRALSLLFLSGCLLLTGCSKDDEELDIPGKPNEENVVVLTREVEASIPLLSAGSVAPPGEWFFCLADEDENEYMIPGSAGEKKDGTYMHLLLPAGTKCVTYTVKYVTNEKQTDGYDLGFTITLEADGSITCKDIWNEDLELFGKGTKEWPYKISSLKDIRVISGYSDDTSWEGVCFKQICDIYCDEGSNKKFNENNGGIQPIGMKKPFKGHYNGSGYVIDKLKFIASGTTDNIGLFGTIEGNATIDSVRIETVNILKANKNIGALVAVMKDNSSVSNCSVKGGNISGISNIGGLVGYMEGGSVTDCLNDNCNVISNQQNNPYTNCIGGVIGIVNAIPGSTIRISNIESNANVSGNENIGGVIGLITSSVSTTTLLTENLTMGLMDITGERSVGGIIGGCALALTLNNATNRAVIGVQGKDRKNIGGIIGSISTSGKVVMENCQSGYNKLGTQADPSQKYIDGAAYTGGIIGYARAELGLNLTGCRLTSNTCGTDYVGGLVGYCVSDIVLDNCRNDGGNIQASGSYAGGLIGQAIGIATFSNNCVNQGNVTAKGSYAGGFIACGNNVTIKTGLSQANVTASQKYSGGYAGWSKSLTAEAIDMSTVTGTIAGNEVVGGLAGFVSNGTINNVTLGIIVGEKASTAIRTGGLIGELGNGTITCCTFTGSVQGGEKTGGIVGYQQEGKIDQCTVRSENKILCHASGEVGGIAGAIVKTTISHCENYTTVTNVKGEHLTGGIVGYVDEQPDSKQISDCYNYALITGGDQTGGIIGGQRNNKNSNIQVARCHNKGIINGKDEVGGITGSLIQGQLYQCSNTAGITGARSAGGISGCMYGTENYYPGGLINQCYNTGTINAPENVGGIAGRIFGWSHARIENSYNKGMVGNDNSTRCAGIAGSIDNNAYCRIEYCYSGGTQRTGWGIAGRYFSLVGSEVTFVKCHYSSESAPTDTQKNSDYTRNSNAGLSSESNFSGWDFSNVWVMKTMPELVNNRETK